MEILRDVYPTLVNTTLRVCWLTFIRLQQSSKYIRTIALQQCLSLINEGFYEINKIQNIRKEVTIESLVNYIKLEKNIARMLMFGISLHPTNDIIPKIFHHTSLRITIILRLEFAIILGLDQVQLRKSATGMEWIRDSRKHPHFSEIVIFLRDYLPEVYKELRS